MSKTDELSVKPKRTRAELLRLKAQMMRNERERRKAAGLCPQCGQEQRDFNRHTGAPYYLGPNCRAAFNADNKLRMRQRRADGRAKMR